MGIGQFPAWDNFELDMGKIQILDKQFDKVKNHHPEQNCFKKKL